MAYINTTIPQAGIVGLLYYKKSTGKALSSLAHTLLHGPSSLTPAERELIAAHVSYLNNCEFCFNSHAGVANSHLHDNGKTVQCVVTDIETAPVSDKMKVLLHIAGKVQQSGRLVTPDLIEAAKKKGATDEEIHDAVLVAAAFCMYNRYVDGLNTQLPVDNQEYVKWGQRLADKGYKYAPGFILWFVRKMMRKEPTEMRPREENWK
jgi:uncharacterized peroxidase-related enzyme